MHVGGESDGCVVPVKCPNNGGPPPAEGMEGVDGVTWKEYETELEPRLAELQSRVHPGTYRAQPSKSAYIPKADGRQRPDQRRRGISRLI